MKKPTREDLERIKNELDAMRQYMEENHPVKIHPKPSDMVYCHIVDAIDEVEHCIDRLPDLRENVISDC